MRSILSKQAGTSSVFQKYASPLESYSSPRSYVALENADAFTKDRRCFRSC